MQVFTVRGFKKGSVLNGRVAVPAQIPASSSESSSTSSDTSSTWKDVRVLSDGKTDTIIKIKSKHLRPIITIKDSELVPSQQGLFAARDYKAGEVIFQEWSLLTCESAQFFWKVAENERCMVDLYQTWLSLRRRWPERCALFNGLCDGHSQSDWLDSMRKQLGKVHKNDYYRSQLWKAEQMDLDKKATESETAKFEDLFSFEAGSLASSSSSPSSSSSSESSKKTGMMESSDEPTVRDPKKVKLEDLMKEATSTIGLRHAQRDAARMIFPFKDPTGVSGLSFQFELALRVLCIFMNNAWDDSVYELISFMNHSCSNNVTVVPIQSESDDSGIPDVGESLKSSRIDLSQDMIPVDRRKGLAVVALRDIRKGQELSLCYLNNPLNKYFNDFLQYQNQELRRMGLYKCNGFICKCQRCDQNKNDDSRSFFCQRESCLPDYKGIIRWKSSSPTFFQRCNHCGMMPSPTDMKLFMDMEKAVRYFLENYCYSGSGAKKSSSQSSSSIGDAYSSFSGVKQPRALSAVMLTVTGDVTEIDMDEADEQTEEESKQESLDVLGSTVIFDDSSLLECGMESSEKKKDQKVLKGRIKGRPVEMGTQTGIDDSMEVVGGLTVQDFGLSDDENEEKYSEDQKSETSKLSEPSKITMEPSADEEFEQLLDLCHDVLTKHGLLVSLYHYRCQLKPNLSILELRYLQMCEIYDHPNPWLLRSADNLYRAAMMRRELFQSLPDVKAEEDFQKDNLNKMLEPEELAALERHFNFLKKVLRIQDDQQQQSTA